MCIIYCALSVSQTVAPIVTRIEAVKAQFADVEKIKYKLEAKDEDIRELRKQLKLKVSAVLRVICNPQ